MTSEELQEKIEEVHAFIMQRMQDGTAPEVVLMLYHNIGPEKFKYFLCGFICGQLDERQQNQSEIFRFIKDEIDVN